MALRGQGDSPVRICEPCKKLEEAARFELRQGRRPGRGSLKSAPREEDEILDQILGKNDELLSSGKKSTSDKGRGGQRSASVASSSNTKGLSINDDEDIQKIVSNETTNSLGIEVGSTTPDELRQQALAEKSKYKILKGDGKSEEALRAFKRGKELERQANALEIQLRKEARKKLLPSGNLSDMHNKDIPGESDRKTKSLPRTGKDKDDLTSELIELGWSDKDLHKEDRKSANLSLEGEFSSLIGETFGKTGEEKGSRIDKTEVVAMKKKALILKREGKLAEAKEELKRAKILEKQLEEEELLAGAEDSDDELSALIRGMDDDKEFPDLHDREHAFDFDNLLNISDNLDSIVEVTDDDLMDPELAGALESLGWTEPENTFSKSQTFDKEALLSEIQSLKREAVNQKRAGNTEEAMVILKKAKLLERDLNNAGSDDDSTMLQKFTPVRKSEITSNERNNNVANNANSAVAPKSRLMIQRELLNSKKKILTLRREGKMNEAEEEMRKSAVLEHQLTEIDNAPSHKSPLMNNVLHATSRNQPLEEGSEDDVTDKDMSDPTYLSLLTDLGWNDDNDKSSKSSNKPSKKYDDNFIPINDTSLSQHSTSVLVEAPRRSKAELQRELLSLKRKALALRREGKAEDAEEVLKTAKTLEAKIEEMDALKNKVQVEAPAKKERFNFPVDMAVDEERDVVVSEEDMLDPALNSLLTNLGWKDEGFEPVKEEPVKEATSTITTSRNKGEIQRELLVLKRKALALRRKGEIEEADEILKMAKNLEAQLEDYESQNKDLLLNASKEKKSVPYEAAIGLERINDETNIPLSRKSDNLSPATSNSADDKHPISSQVSASSENLAKRMKVENIIGHSSSTGHSMHMPDLLTGDDCSSSEVLSKKNKEYKVGSANSSQTGPTIGLDSSVNLSQELIYKSSVATQRIKVTDVDEKPNTNQSNAVPDYASQDDLSLRQEILAHKRKAVALKREGKLTEAREELRQAKLLEKRLEDGSTQPNTASTSNEDGSTQPNTASTSNVSNASNAVPKKQDSPNAAVKPLTSRDRFKLQQQSLAHKRQALKLRREGRTEEAEAEFERAKAIENQLEELAAHDANKSDTGDDVSVEDFLDPQLLSALKAVGLEDVSVVSKKSPEKQESVKPVAKIENSNQEKIQLEERIKEEKLKAVSLKRSGKQAEALDALRRAKMYEKKLNSLISG
ncbi:FYVE zinc finger protein [Trifolium pratense]|uniref:FYVE zinc finger protein n=1 Tax=Trifolium pratense TaxID=57577 RepID=A0A2K3MNU8_TRIPR|nr:FYVE zinc finger protein [Trifolium pratense]PNY12451.1 FYVE zinc finger protein [Trifolium pratense]PNY15894.1 FYVE zinc finger protein [Trifolium pratense]